MACDYLAKYRFGVTVASYPSLGAPLGAHGPVHYFKSVTGIEKDIEVKEFKLNQEPTVKKFPGFTRPGLVTMERAVYGVEDPSNTRFLEDAYYFRDWYYEIVDPATGLGLNNYMREVKIYVLDREDKDQRIVTLQDAWPVKYTFPDLDATDSDIGYEQIQLRCATMLYDTVATPVVFAFV